MIDIALGRLAVDLLIGLAIVAGAKILANRIAAAITRRRWRRSTARELAEIRRLEREILERETAAARRVA